ncbi:MAG: hypothetical protein M1814_001621 [Vezdaea aestivalis]|nr:MAG: hypothetical protein M1814_001621 [Vezdaea aestivalis]
MKVFEASCTYNYSWEEISTAQWRKYGSWNDKSTHVVAVDTLSRSVDPATGILRTERLITCRQAAPKWMTYLIGSEPTSHVYETSHVDPGRKVLTMTSTNLTWSSALSVRETIVYRPLSPTKTEFQQDAKVVALCGGWQKLKNKIEDATVERFSQNAQQGREGFEHVLEMSRRVFGEEKQKEQMRRQIQQAA